MEDETRRALRVVDRALRDAFPTDFHKRCLYAAFGTRDVLRARGVPAVIVGGDFRCFMMSRDRKRATLEGFGGSAERNQPSHFWLECDGRRLDLGPHYLPRESQYPVVSVPVVRWSMQSELPSFLRYTPNVFYDRDAVLNSTAEVIERMAQFVERCYTLDRSMKPIPAKWDWELTDMTSLKSAASRGDRWAQGAIRYLSIIQG